MTREDTMMWSLYMNNSNPDEDGNELGRSFSGPVPRVGEHVYWTLKTNHRSVRRERLRVVAVEWGLWTDSDTPNQGRSCAVIVERMESP